MCAKYRKINFNKCLVVNQRQKVLFPSHEFALIKSGNARLILIAELQVHYMLGISNSL